MARSDTKKTNACRELDKLGIAYELKPYEIDVSDLSAATVARKVGLPLEQVFKTLCLRGGDGSILLAVLPGDCELDLKATARAASQKTVAPVKVDELQRLTGYIRGGVTALACKKPYPVFVDSRAERCGLISISAGQRGLQIWLAPVDYLRATHGTLAPIATPSIASA